MVDHDYMGEDSPDLGDQPTFLVSYLVSQR